MMILLAVGLAGCDDDVIKEKDIYVVAGQSNAVLCNWWYFEYRTDSEVKVIADGGKTIGYLYNDFENKRHIVDGFDVKAIIFVHGESDAMNKNPVYAEKVEAYRGLIGDVPLLISNVGYFGYHKKDNYPDVIFDSITKQVNDEIEVNDSWILAFDDAKNFPDWGMLESDGVHFTEAGCMMMMDAMANAVANIE